jgi:hypothetical protein
MLSLTMRSFMVSVNFAFNVFLSCQLFIYYTNRSVYHILTERQEMSIIIYREPSTVTIVFYYPPDIV